jgi:hypothetical protein
LSTRYGDNNELYRLGKDLDYGKRAEMLTSIDKPPYYALKFGPALLNVFGGVLTDMKMHVLDKDQNPIPGLFAVGQRGRRSARHRLPAPLKRQQSFPRPYLGKGGSRGDRDGGLIKPNPVFECLI